MLMSIMGIICYVSLGLMIGVVIMSVIANSGYIHKCDDCFLKDMFSLYNDELYKSRIERDAEIFREVIDNE